MPVINCARVRARQLGGRADGLDRPRPSGGRLTTRRYDAPKDGCMAQRIRLIVIMAIVFGAFVGGWVSAQSIAVVPVTPTVLSGENIGCRVEGYRGGVAVGRLVVQVDGKWVDAEFNGGVRRL